MKMSILNSTIITLFLFASIPGVAIDLTKSGKGTVVLTDNTVYYGELTFHQTLDLVSIHKDGRMYTFSAFQVRLFQYYDAEHELNRIFAPVEIMRADAYYVNRNKKFLELVMHGDFVIMRKETIKMQENIDTEDRTLLLKRNLVSEPSCVTDFDYYFSQDGQVCKLNNFKKQILPLMNDHPEVLAFIHDSKINLDNWEGQYRVFDFYNNLKATVKNPPTEHQDLTL